MIKIFNRLFFFILLLKADASIGQTGSALSFDGINDYVNLIPSSAFPTSGPVSVEAWINYTDGPTNLPWFKRGANNGYGLYILNNIIYVITYGVSNWNTGVTLTPGIWTHVTFTFDGTTQRIYKNGILSASLNAGYMATDVSPTIIGANFAGSEAGYFHGLIDELKIWNKALSDVEIQDDMNCEIAATQNGLIAYYNFNEGIASGSNSGTSILHPSFQDVYKGTLTNFSLSGSVSNWVSPGAVLNGNTCYPPSISAFTPTNATAGDMITISGVNFATTTSVSFGGILASSFVVINSSTINAYVSNSGSSGDIVITTNYGTATLAGFIYNNPSAPTITNFNPLSGPEGTQVTILGTNFNTIQTNNIVYFGATKAIVNSSTSTNMVVTAPAGATYSPITVLNASSNSGLMGSSINSFTPTYTPNTGAIFSENFLPKIEFPIDNMEGANAIGDMDGDGKPDAVVVNGNYISILPNISTSGNIAFSEKINFRGSSNIISLLIKDLDGDGKLDIVGLSSDSIFILHNKYNGGGIASNSFDDVVKFFIGSGSTSLAIGDMNSDGKPDFIVSNSTSNTVSVAFPFLRLS